MTKRFLNVFDNIDIDEDLRELMRETDVVKISTNPIKNTLHVIISGGEELKGERLFRLQSALKKGLFGDKNIFVSILREDRIDLRRNREMSGGETSGNVRTHASAAVSKDNPRSDKKQAYPQKKHRTGERIGEVYRYR